MGRPARRRGVIPDKVRRSHRRLVNAKVMVSPAPEKFITFIKFINFINFSPPATMNVLVHSKNLPHPVLQKFKLFKPFKLFNLKLFDLHRLRERRATSAPSLGSDGPGTHEVGGG